jgi:hypothetical protein
MQQKSMDREHPFGSIPRHFDSSKGSFIMRLPILFAIGLTVSIFSGTASAKQYVRNVQGREVVVHTSPIPVVLHRLVPPQHGRHVTQRELQTGRVPQPSRYGTMGR